MERCFKADFGGREKTEMRDSVLESRESLGNQVSSILKQGKDSYAPYMRGIKKSWPIYL